VVGTEAFRQRHPAEAFNLVRDLLGCEVEVLEGGREAALGFHGAHQSGAPDSRPHASVTIDIGYGSTELATIGADGDLRLMSLPIGAASVTSSYLQSDPPRADELSAALSVIELHLDDVKREQPQLAEALADDQVEVVGLGAIRFVSEVELGSSKGDEIDGYRLEYRAVEEVFRTLATESSKDRAANPGLRAEHVSWIVGAMCILVETMRQFGVDYMRTSTAGILDGLLLEEQKAGLSADIDGPRGPRH
jgi:exopolyphosphatase/guanosine-5'-triphosphate,3'-diphosphate pyrophosphatase